MLDFQLLKKQVWYSAEWLFMFPLLRLTAMDFNFYSLVDRGSIIIWFYIFTRLALPRNNIFFVFWNHSSKCTKQNVGKKKKGPKSSIRFSSYSYKTWKHYFLLLTIQLKWVCPTYTFDTYFFNNWMSSTTASMSKNVENILLCKVKDE